MLKCLNARGSGLLSNSMLKCLNSGKSGLLLLVQLHISSCLLHHVTSQIYPTLPSINHNDDKYRNSHKSVTPGVLKLGYLTGSRKLNDDILYHCPGQFISGAITLAVDKINNDSVLLPNTLLQFVIAETYGKEEESIRQTVQLQEMGIDAFIGPQETCIHEGRMAAAFNKPMISYYCTAPKLSDKTLYPTFARTKPHDSQISMSVVSLLLQYSWKKVVVVYSDEKEQATLAQHIMQVFKKYGITVTNSIVFDGPYFPDTTINDSPFVRIVGETYQSTRVYVMVSENYEFQGLMVALKKRGLVDTGEYVVVGVDHKKYDLTDPTKYIEGVFQRYSESDLAEIAASFQNVLIVLPAAPVYPWFSNFTEIVNYYLESPPFNFPNKFRPMGILKNLYSEAAFLYDAVYIYARAADQALANGEDPSDGKTIFKYIKGTTYLSAMGYMNRINRDGNCQGNFTLLKRSFDGKKYGMHPVGTFLLNQNDSGIPQLQINPGDQIDWVSGKPPVDEPECGFIGEYCIPVENHLGAIVGGSLAGVLFIVVIIGVVVYRNWKYEQELTSLLWKIDYKDLKIQEHASQYLDCYHGVIGSMQNHTVSKMPNGLRCSIVSLNSIIDFEQRQVFTLTGHYKGQLVAIKMLNKRNVDLSRAVRKELKIIRDLRHDNLNPFIGACVDSNNVCIIIDYCTKGSLQDILANDDLRIDSMFIASLVFDIIKGMIFLHDSEIRSHGRLKSSNCVVDSRWVLKITDYGLCEFKRDPSYNNDLTEHQYFQSLLWTAPELLREADPPRCGTQKGDIFSFAIIMYELHGRNGPYGDIMLSPKEIISRVVNRDNQDMPYRPHLSNVSSVAKTVTDCIKACWNEDPTQRPADFKIIRRMLKPMQKGMKPNIFDNMMAMMEKYASNLEEIVDERTDMLREEKKKTEELLHQMLPRSVTEQLKQGKQVEAEAFDSVTIYFSDICGFTALSSESTPMQIVDLLNDLYIKFDAIIAYYDVYKVETIGDAYMVVSGLPSRNGIKHAGEIASMSLHLLDAINHFKLRHRPNYKLKLRIGIHSGPCVAGVVGSRMPRYCLFGDTVNTSSRMESNGQPLKIHCSQDCKDLLVKIGGYHTESRGIVQMKGKGDMHTYWVTGEDHLRRLEPAHVITYGDHSPFPNRVRKISSSPRLNYRHSLDSTNALPVIADNSPTDENPPSKSNTLGVLHHCHSDIFRKNNSHQDLLNRHSMHYDSTHDGTPHSYEDRGDLNINRMLSQGHLNCDCSSNTGSVGAGLESLSKYLSSGSKRASSVKIRFHGDHLKNDYLLNDHYRSQSTRSPGRNGHQWNHHQTDPPVLSGGHNIAPEGTPLLPKTNNNNNHQLPTPLECLEAEV